MSGEKENLSGNVGDAGIQFPPAKRNRKGRSGRKQKSTIDEGSHQEVMSPHSKSIRGTKAGGRHAILFALDQTELEDEQSSSSDGNTASPFSTMTISTKTLSSKDRADILSQLSPLMIVMMSNWRRALYLRSRDMATSRSWLNNNGRMSKRDLNSSVNILLAWQILLGQGLE